MSRGARTKPAASASLDCRRASQRRRDHAGCCRAAVSARRQGLVARAARQPAFRALVLRLDRLAVRPGNRDLGHQLHHRVGRGDRELRLVDRDRQRRHADLGHAAADAAAMAQLDQPFRGGNDAVRGRDRRHHADHPSGPADLRLLARPLSQHDGALAAVAQRAGLGFLGDRQLSAVFDPVLVRQPDSRSRHHARPHTDARGTIVVWRLRAGLARLGQRTGAGCRPCIPRWPRSAFPWSARCTRSSGSTSPRA